jgi:hypothetical protein
LSYLKKPEIVVEISKYNKFHDHETFFSSNEPISLAHNPKKKVETMEAPQNRRFYTKMECLPLWPTYIGEEGRILGKISGIKERCYGEHIGNLRNILGT